MDLSFGTRLREQRERQRLPITAIADDTKIKASLLEALERDDLTHWPKGIFRRSYVRAYARAIGLDSDTTLREFLALYPDPPGETLVGIGEAVEALTDASRPPTRLGFLISSAIGVLPSRRIQNRQHRGTAAIHVPDLSSVSSTGASSVWADRHDAGPAVVVMTGAEPAAEPSSRLDAQVPHAAEDPLVDASAGALRPEVDDAKAGAGRDGVDLAAIADLCSRLACAGHATAIAGVFEDAAKLLDAVGMILWVWDPRALKLRPVLSHGYPSELVARLPFVPRDAENGIAIAFRSAETCIIDGSETGPGAVVVPLLTSTECAGVLALELQNRGEASESVRACATILAAQLSTIVGYPSLVHSETV